MKTAKWLALVARAFSATELFCILLVLFIALLIQFGLNELPCPLCLLQRIGFLSVAFGLLLNLRYGPRPSHYAIVLLSALFTSFVALRQIALHVLPGTGEYGSAILGFHLYTWVFILSMVIVVATTLVLSIDQQYLIHLHKSKRSKMLIHALYLLLVFVLLANILSVLFECGLHACPDNPTSYALVIR